MSAVNSDTPDPFPVIVILGGSNDKTGRLSQMSVDRCDQAMITHAAHPCCRILTTGGWGKHFNETPNPHGDLMRNELISRGIDESLFYPTAISGHTEADATGAKAILKSEPLTEILLITSDFHMARAQHYFRLHFNGIRISPCPAPSTLSPNDLKERVRHEQTRMAELEHGLAP